MMYPMNWFFLTFIMPILISLPIVKSTQCILLNSVQSPYYIIPSKKWKW